MSNSSKPTDNRGGVWIARLYYISRWGCAAQQASKSRKPRSDETRHDVFLERRKTSESDRQGGRSARCRRIRRRLEEECSEKLVFKNQ
ncbi:unnamed protein product [Caenorhabditis nigoni]